MKFKIQTILITLFFVFMALPGAFCEWEGRYADGKYEGEYSFVKVQVTVRGGGMTDIKMLHHGGGGEEYAKMVRPLLSEMVKKQTTNIDAVTGATVSSNNLKKAVNNALEKAAR
ncbi:MAG: FMN-binding protein [Candidatus Omnitrophota bacterium]